MNRIRAGNITDTEAERLTREIAIIKQDYANVIMIDRCYHIDSIITAIRRAVIKFDIEVVIIDHIGLIEGGRGESRNIQLADISRRIAQEKNAQDIIIIALSQMNREIEKRAAQRPILADLRDSGSLEQDADMVWFMHRKERAEAETLFDIAKNRDGVTGDFNLYFDASRLTFNSENLNFDGLQTFGGV
jgi:replicative DNA helicase